MSDEERQGLQQSASNLKAALQTVMQIRPMSHSLGQTGSAPRRRVLATMVEDTLRKHASDRRRFCKWAGAPAWRLPLEPDELFRGRRGSVDPTVNHNNR